MMKNKYCPNCHYPLEGEPKFCGNCGQKNKKERFRFRELMAEFFGNLFNFDSKIWRTPLALFKPGFLSTEFFKGKRARYTPPGRLLLVSLVIYFGVSSIITKNDSSFFQFSNGDNTERDSLMANWNMLKYLENKEDTLKLKLSNEIDSKVVTQVLDTLKTNLYSKQFSDSIALVNIKISNEDWEFLPPEEIFEKYEIEGFWKKLFISRLMKTQRTPEMLSKYIQSHLSWGVLASVPVLGLLLLMFYFRKKMFYTEHVVFVIHVLSFFFIVATLGLFLENMFPLLDFFSLYFPIGSLVYLFFGMKQYYKQGYVKTGVKFLLFSTLSAITFLLGAVVFFLVSMALF